ncbi:uncharacterized protein LOC114940415 [Nylanderia fulva]|uniref:uncharacterized protein LOC114940415 n=1 Tax=Nylanderia fulva TaxID=613905 RepID=UPI0010FB818A|nr:uncharacterized protein LOC114940415 [Nylanderia fulva]
MPQFRFIRETKSCSRIPGAIFPPNITVRNQERRGRLGFEHEHRPRISLSNTRLVFLIRGICVKRTGAFRDVRYCLVKENWTECKLLRPSYVSIADKLCARFRDIERVIVASRDYSFRIMLRTRNTRVIHASRRECRVKFRASGVPCKVSGDRNYSCFRECRECYQERRRPGKASGDVRAAVRSQRVVYIYYNSAIAGID